MYKKYRDFKKKIKFISIFRKREKTMLQPITSESISKQINVGSKGKYNPRNWQGNIFFEISEDSKEIINI